MFPLADLGVSDIAALPHIASAADFSLTISSCRNGALPLARPRELSGWD